MTPRRCKTKLKWIISAIALLLSHENNYFIEAATSISGNKLTINTVQTRQAAVAKPIIRIPTDDGIYESGYRSGRSGASTPVRLYATPADSIFDPNPSDIEPVTDDEDLPYASSPLTPSAMNFNLGDVKPDDKSDLGRDEFTELKRFADPPFDGSLARQSFAFDDRVAKNEIPNQPPKRSIQNPLGRESFAFTKTSDPDTSESSNSKDSSLKPDIFLDLLTQQTSSQESFQEANVVKQRYHRKQELFSKVAQSSVNEHGQQDSIANRLRQVVSKLHDQKIQNEYIGWLVQGAFWEARYKLPSLPEPDGTKASQRFGNLQKLADLIHKQPNAKKSIMQIIDDASERLMENNRIPWQQMHIFKSLLGQFLFYYNLFNVMHAQQFLMDVDIWSFHAHVPTLAFYVTSASFINKLIEAVRLMSANSNTDPILELQTKFKIFGDLDESEKAELEAESGQQYEDHSAAGNTASEQSFSSLDELHDSSDKQKTKFRTKFENVHAILSDVENAGSVLSTVDHVAKSSIKIDTNLHMDLLSIVNGVVSIADQRPPASAKLKATKAPLILSGANFALSCVNLIMKPKLLRSEQTIILSITIKALDLIEQWRNANSNVPVADDIDPPIE